MVRWSYSLSILSLTVVLSFTSALESYAAKVGKPCAKLNSKSWDGNIPITCQKKSNGKLEWTKFKTVTKSPDPQTSKPSPESSVKPSPEISSTDFLKISKIVVQPTKNSGLGTVFVQFKNLSKTASHIHRAFDWVLKSSSGKLIDKGYISDFPILAQESSLWIQISYIPHENEVPAILELSKVPTYEDLPLEEELPKISEVKNRGSILSFKLENQSSIFPIVPVFQYRIACLDASSNPIWLAEYDSRESFAPKTRTNVSIEVYSSLDSCASIQVNMSLRYGKRLAPNPSPSADPTQTSSGLGFTVTILISSGYAITEDYLGKRLATDLVDYACRTGYVYDTVKGKLNYRAKLGDQFRLDSSGKTVALGKLSSFQKVSETEIGPKYEPFKGTLCLLKAEISNVPTFDFYALYLNGVRIGDYSLNELKKGLVFNQVGLP